MKVKPIINETSLQKISKPQNFTIRSKHTQSKGLLKHRIMKQHDDKDELLTEINTYIDKF